jgi:alkylation response protein AidB-like acyl-CoA dehydrogenase
MRFAFSEEQLEFAQATRDLLAKECTPAHLRAAWSNATGRSEGAWSALVEMGVTGVLIPESSGGLGLTEVDLVLLLEETGRCALPEPIVDTALVAAPESWVRIDETAACVLPESPLAVWADTAAVIVVLAADGVRVIRREDVTLAQRRSVDGARRLFDVTVPDHVAPIAPVAAAARAFRRGALGTAAQLLGLADQMIEMTVGYAREREQFGVKIGTFQAVKHHLADARVKLEFARPLVYRAAWSLKQQDAAASTHVSMAKVQAGEAALLAARVALQCHGAIGYTTEYDLHLYMKRAWALEKAWGDTTWHRRAVGRALRAGGDQRKGS